MSDWTKRNKENIWDKSCNRVPSGMHVGVSTTIVTDRNAKWEPDVARGIGMKRIDPCIRMVAYTCVPPCPPFTYGSSHELYISWNREPSENEEPYKEFIKDSQSSKFIGIHKSSSSVMTALKKWMKEN